MAVQEHTAIAWSHIGPVLAVRVQPDTPIPEEEWGGLLAAIETFGGASIFVWVVGGGRAAVTVGQMRPAARLVRDLRLSAVVFTTDKATRALVTAASWIGADVESEDPDRLGVVLERLVVSAAERLRVDRFLGA